MINGERSLAWTSLVVNGQSFGLMNARRRREGKREFDGGEGNEMDRNEARTGVYILQRLLGIYKKVLGSKHEEIGFYMGF